MVRNMDIDTLISYIFNSTDKGLSMNKAENHAHQLVNIAREKAIRMSIDIHFL